MGVIVKPEVCPNCGKGLSFKKDPYTMIAHGNDPSNDKGCFRLRCKDRTCNKELPLFANTFFNFRKLPVHRILHLLHLWLGGSTIRTMILITGISEPTIIGLRRAFRKMVSQTYLQFLDTAQDEDLEYDQGQIGGPGVEVQIDESAFGKRKYNLGHYVDTKWVFGGIEITNVNGKKRGGRFFAVVVPDRSKESLIPVLRKFIRPGTEIVSDGWSAYRCVGDLTDEGEQEALYTHFSVNHSLHYVDPESGRHTNTIEGKWGALKKAIPRQGFREGSILQEYLGEQWWRNVNKGHLWEASLEALKNFVPE